MKTVKLAGSEDDQVFRAGNVELRVTESRNKEITVRTDIFALSRRDRFRFFYGWKLENKLATPTRIVRSI